MNHHRHIVNVLLCFLGALSAGAANDIANFSRYENDNKRLMAEPNTGTRVVFMGNSITDNWATGRPEFFELNDLSDAASAVRQRTKCSCVSGMM